MNSGFTFVKSDADFKALSENGIKQILIKADENVFDLVKKAASYKMKVILRFDADAKMRKKTIAPHAGRIICETGYVTFVSIHKLKETINELGKLIRCVVGVVIPPPETKCLLWNNDIKKICGFQGEAQLYDLFDEEIERSLVRSEYYIGLNKYIISNYMNPQIELMEEFGIKTIFDISDLSSYEDTVGKMISPFMLKKEKLTLATTRKNGIIEKETGFTNDDFVITEDGIYGLGYASGEILLVAPFRGVLERIVKNPKRKQGSRIENAALLAAIEGVWYGGMLHECGYDFDVKDESFFSGNKDISQYKTMLICESCLFEEKEMAKIKELENRGISINPQDLIHKLITEGES